MLEVMEILGSSMVWAATLMTPQAPAPVASPGPVLELRQYKIASGRRDEFIAFFERHFVEPQDAAGMPLLGQFRDTGDSKRFTWIRSFSDMVSRKRVLTDFYTGPVWQAHRNTANPMLEDNDNVLLLRPARTGSGFEATPPRPAAGATAPATGAIVVNIHYLWKEPADGFTDFFLDRVAPVLSSAGLPVLGAYVSEKAENTFPRLPVRQGEKVFVWFTRASGAEAYRREISELTSSARWQSEFASSLADFEERPAQVLVLTPTPRSALR